MYVLLYVDALDNPDAVVLPEIRQMLLVLQVSTIYMMVCILY